MNRFCLNWKQSAEIEARDVYLYTATKIEDDSWAMKRLMAGRRWVILDWSASAICFQNK